MLSQVSLQGLFCLFLRFRLGVWWPVLNSGLVTLTLTGRGPSHVTGEYPHAFASVSVRDFFLLDSALHAPPSV